MKQPRSTKVVAGITSIVFGIFLLGLVLLPALSVKAHPSAAGVFVVNSGLDTQAKDSVLTLREAVMIDQGVLTGPFSDLEKAQITGCGFSGSTNNWTVSGCGAGIPAFIYFAGNYTITLGSALPVLADASTVISTTGSQRIKINANNGNYNVFEITGNDVQLNGLRVYGSGTDWSNIWVTGSAVRVILANDTVGIDDAYTGAYGQSPHSYGGIYINSNGGTLNPGDARVWIYGLKLCCHSASGSEGISLVNTDNVVIGEDPVGNAGTSQHNIINNNLGYGLRIRGSSFSNTIRNSDIGANGIYNVWLTDGSHANTVEESSIYYGGKVGVQIDNGAYLNRIGSPFGSSTPGGNAVFSNTYDGLYISGTTTYGNFVFGNKIGLYPNGTTVDGNGHNGLVLDYGTYNNFIGYGASEVNVIGGNRWDGIVIANGAHNNLVQANDIGLNRSMPVLAASSALEPMAPAQPAGGGGSYLALPNNGDGIALFGAMTNTVGNNNFVFYNHASGIYVASNSRANVVGNNTLRSNAYYGVIIDNSSYNTITRTQIDHNGYDGIGERNGAIANVWSEVGIYGNGGLGIDKNAYNDALNIVDAPYVFIDSINSGVVKGRADSTDNIFTIAQVELYRAYPNGSGFGDGWEFVGRATTDNSGNWIITDTLPVALSPTGGGGGGAKCYTAFVTEAFPLLLVPFHSSEFGPNTCRTFLPLVLKNH